MNEQTFAQWVFDRTIDGKTVSAMDAWNHQVHLRKNDIAAAKMLQEVIEQKNIEIAELKHDLSEAI
jgi:predicted alpha-1,6-mannanase (GH76 family)